MAKRGVGICKPRLQQARYELGLSQQQLADDIGIHRVTIANIERGSACSLEVLELLCERLGRSRKWLTGEPEDIDQVSLAREALSDSLAALEQSASRLVDLMDALDGRVRETVAAQAVTKVEVEA